MDDPHGSPTLWERHPWLEEIRPLIEAAASRASILLRGASPRMCEIVARTIHAASLRHGPFLAVDCAAFAPLELEDHVFDDRMGLFVFPEHTLYVKEAADMPGAIQGRFLQALGDRRLPWKNGLIAATKQDLGSLVARGSFLAELHSQLKMAEIPVPPLTEEERRLAEAEELEALRHEWARREQIDAHNGACRALAMTRQGQGPACPYSRHASPDDIEFVDHTGEARRSFFVCRTCGRSFGHEL